MADVAGFPVQCARFVFVCAQAAAGGEIKIGQEMAAFHIAAVAGFFQRCVGIGGGVRMLLRPHGKFNAAVKIVLAACCGELLIGFGVERFFGAGKKRQQNGCGDKEFFIFWFPNKKAV